MTSPPPDVTVVIPTHNRWHLLSTSSLPSALAQEDIELEVVVVDDGSSDATPSELERLSHRRLRKLRHDQPRGVAAARNTGISAAHGEWVAFLDDDDLWSPQKLRMQLETARSEDAAFVYAAAVVLDEHGKVIEVAPAPDADSLAADLRSRYVIPGGPSNVVARTDLLRRLGGFDEALSYLADWDMWLRLAANGKPAACPECLVGYVRHPERMLPSRRQALDELNYLDAKHRQAGMQIEPGQFVAWVARQHSGAGKRVAAANILMRSALAFRRPYYVVRAGAALLDGPVSDHVRSLVYMRRGQGRKWAPPPPPEWLSRAREARL
jgi:glycosyltransferase involved in cell wall biosynthesis